jgi:hypothetical protein
MLVPKTYPLLVRAIEEGVTYGYRKAHKHDDAPSESDIRAAIEDAVMFQISDTFDFVDPKKP